MAANTAINIAVIARDRATKTLRNLSREVGGFGKTVTSAFGKVGFASAVALTGMAVASTKMAIEFEKNMANVATLLSGSPSGVSARVAELGEGVKDLAEETGKPLSDLAGGLYQVISAFGDTPQSITLLETAAKAAVGGLSTTTEAVNLLSAVTKGYGDTSAGAVAKVADLAFVTVRLGQTTFPELAAAIGRVTPLAASLQLPIEELFGAFATLTGVTGTTAEVSTQLRGILQALINPSDELAGAIEKMGFANGMSAIKGIGLNGVLQELMKQTGGNTAEIAKLFPSVEALNAVLALGTTQSQTFADKTAAMTEATGAATRAFETQDETVGQALARLRSSFQRLMVDLGAEFLPLLEEFAAWVKANIPEIKSFFVDTLGTIAAGVRDLINWWRDMDQGTKDNILSLGKFLVVALPIVAVVGSVATMISKLVPVVLLAGKVFGGLTTLAELLGGALMFLTTNPVGLVIAGIAAIVAAGVLLYNHWDEVKAFAVKTWDAIGEHVITAVRILAAGLTLGFSEILIAFVKHWDEIKAGFLGLKDAAFDWGSDMMSGFFSGITGWYTKIKDSVTGFVSDVVGQMKGALGINSPSKVFMEMGAFSAEGFQLGLRKGMESMSMAPAPASVPAIPGGSNSVAFSVAFNNTVRSDDDIRKMEAMINRYWRQATSRAGL